MKTTGAKHVFINASVLRRGTHVPEAFKMPTGLKTRDAKVLNGQSGEKEIKPEEKAQSGKPADENLLKKSMPIRIPHLDSTPLGARQFIRSQERDIYNTAVETGVIAAEDKICQNQPFLAQSKDADRLIAEHYNQNGELGPRYAAYSIWRPLNKVGRDPLTLAPRGKTTIPNGDFVYWPYENRIPGPADLNGDYLKEFAMLGVKGESPVNDSDPPQWYYLSGQEPDEVLFVKLFDSAALGEETADAGAPWHASPEIGSVEGDQPRESIELRVLAFW